MLHLRSALTGLFIGVICWQPIGTQAALINYTLENVTFDDGGTASGTFSVDSGSGIVQTADFSTTAGSTLPGFQYFYPASILIQPAAGLPVPIPDPTLSFTLGTGGNGGANFIQLLFEDPLTNGGTDPIVTSLSPTGNPFSFEFCQPGIGGGSLFCITFPIRNVTSGAAVAAVPERIPEPSSLVLLGAAIGLYLLSIRVRAHRSETA